MRFQAKWGKITYVVVPATRNILPTGQELPATKGLRAKFVSPYGAIMDPELQTREPSFFDSEAVARDLAWTDEQRLAVERHLLSHRDFGSGLYLAPGETIPEVHAELLADLKRRGVWGGAPEQAEESASAEGPVSGQIPQCAFFLSDASGVRQCKNPAKKGSDLCGTHQSQQAVV